MTLSDALNSDLGTILQAARRGFDWWVEELAALVSPSVRSWSTRSQTLLCFDGVDGFERPDGTALEANAPRDRDITILLDQGQALIRTIATPAMTRVDLHRMLTLNAERYFPLPAHAMLIASATRANIDDEGKRSTDLAAITLLQASAVARAMDAFGIRPRGVRIATSEGLPDLRFDFLKTMQAAGLIANRQAGRSAWWVLVAALVALNFATLIWRDAAAVEHWQALVDAQRPAVSVAQRMAARMRTASDIAQRASMQRRQHDPLAILARTTAAVPDGAWVQRYAWDGRSLRLTGYRSRDTDVAGALRRVPGFVNVKSAQTDAIAETATGQPFDLVAEIGRP